MLDLARFGHICTCCRTSDHGSGSTTTNLQQHLLSISIYRSILFIAVQHMVFCAEDSKTSLDFTGLILLPCSWIAYRIQIYTFAVRHRAVEQHLKTQIAIKWSRPFLGILAMLGSLVSDHNTPSASRMPLFIIWLYARPSVSGAQPCPSTSPVYGFLRICSTANYSLQKLEICSVFRTLGLPLTVVHSYTHLVTLSIALVYHGQSLSYCSCGFVPVSLSGGSKIHV